MTKRILALVLVCILAIPIMAVPASASQVTGTQFDQFALGLGNLLNEIEGNILYYLEELCYLIVDVIDAISIDIYNAIYELWDYLVQIDSTLDYYMQRLWATLSSLAADIGSYIQSQTTTIVNKITHAVATICQPLNQLVEYVRQLWSGNQGLKPDIDAVGDEIADDEEEYQDNMDIVQDATRPVFDDVYIGYEGLVGGSGVEATIYGEMLALLFEQGGYFYQILFVAFTLSMVSFVVFGKR